MEAAAHSSADLPNRASATRPVLSGVVTGQIAGLIMAIVVMGVFALVFGESPLFPVQVIGSALLGESALHGFNVTAVLAGLVLHQLGPSLLWGAVFGLIASKLSIQTLRGSLTLGVALGIVSMLGPYLLIPALMNTLHGTDFWNREIPIVWDWAAHLVFGLAFGLYPAVTRKLRS